MSNHGGNIEEAIAKYGLKNKRLIDFSANINPLGFPPLVKHVISSGIGRIVDYPDPECLNLKKSLAVYLGVPKENLFIGNGSTELIFLIAASLKLKHALIPAPAFAEYERAIRLSGGKGIFPDILGLPPETRMKKIKKYLNRIDSLFISNPNNPVGFLFTREELYFLEKECAKKGILLIIDEAFMDFTESRDDLSMVTIAFRKNNILVLRSLTKFFALAGLRIGYLVADSNLIRKMAYFRQPWSVNYLAQLAAVHAVKDNSFIRKSRDYIFKERAKLFCALDKTGYLKPYPPEANFILCRITTRKVNSTKLCDYCGRRGFLLRDCSDFRGLDNRFIRIAVRKENENKKLINLLQELA